MTTADRIKSERERQGLTQEDLAKLCGYKNKSSICKVEASGDEVTRKKLAKIANALHVSMFALMGWEDSTIPDIPNIVPITTASVPLLGSVACGKPIYAEQDFVCYVEVGADVHADYGLRARGDSMINARIHDGDIVFVKKTDTVENGDIAVVLIQDEATLKRFFLLPGKAEACAAGRESKV